ncbi:MAG: hypothetical protein ACK4RK_10740 [Gemmataceae bacterium]
MTADVQHAICAYIRAGAYPHVAAEAVGIDADLFARWLRLGLNPSAPRKYRLFRQAVRQAQAQARLKAENDVFSASPLHWLKSGPGKHLPRFPGWTAFVKAPSDRPVNYFASAEFQQLIALIRQVLTPHPDAWQALVEALSHWATDEVET